MKYWFTRKAETKKKFIQGVDDRSWTTIFDFRPGAWQQHTPHKSQDSVLAYPTLFACLTLIQSDIAKLKWFIQRQQNSIWTNTNHKYQALLKNPNPYQNQIQFKESWINSKLCHGNTYGFKVRGSNNVDVKEIHVLDPLMTTPLIADNGEIFYRLNEDRLRKVEEGQTVVPATEIIHDRFNCLFHPLIGLSPIFAAGVNAASGISTQKNMRYFFANGSQPGGVLTAPGPISDATAKRLKEYWQANFTGENSGKIAVAGDGLKYEPMRMSNVDAQVVETLQWNDEKICSVYHVPPYLVGVGEMPTYNNIEALSQAYYSQCLQVLIESLEACFDDGLMIEKNHRVQVDIDGGLFRMDSSSLVKKLTEGLKGVYSPDEARQKLNLPAVPGGQYPYLQQQNYSLEDLAKRSKSDNPFAATGNQPPAPTETPEDDAQQALQLFDTLTKSASIIEAGK